LLIILGKYQIFAIGTTDNHPLTPALLKIAQKPDRVRNVATIRMMMYMLIEIFLYK
jgi:hypothetical protein